MTRRSHRRSVYRLRIAALVAGLISLLAVAVVFTSAVVQVQGAVAAYLGAESIWSRSQLTAVRHLDDYARTGNPVDLARARYWLRVPLGDLEARLTMESDNFNYDIARNGLIQGENHPEDVGAMIWLFRLFSDFGGFRRAADAWRGTDDSLTGLVQIARRLEEAWNQPGPAVNAARIETLRRQLDAVNNRLSLAAWQFREALADSARWITNFLTVFSVILLLGLGVAAAFLGLRLARLLRRAERRFRAIFEQAAVGIAQVSDRGRILQVNRALCNIFNLPPWKLEAMQVKDLVLPEDWELGREQLRQLMTGEIQNYTVEQRLQQGNSASLWARLTVSAVHDEQSRTPYQIVIVEDISESRRLSTELSYQASHDLLTGELNRRAFERLLADTLVHARLEDTTHALCFLDLDQFKVINDTCGHGAGDQLLRQVASVARANLRASDRLARLGGDEFGVLMEHCDLDTASGIAEKLRCALESMEFIWQDASHSLSCSIGVVPVTARTPDSAAVFRAADLACFMAKEQGRNRVYASPEDDQRVLEQRGQMEWLNRIQSALADNRLFLDAQLIVPAKGRSQLLRYEVLVRLRDETGKVVPPGMFLPAAERFGIAHRIDRWVIEEVVSQLAANPEHVRVLDVCHINLSGRSFDQGDLAGFISGLMSRHRVPPGKLCFEITETAAIQNLTDVQAFIGTMRELGCRFALDDFGTGLSSFSYLRRMPVDYLKIDGVFVRDMVHDQTDAAMVRAINDVGQTLGKRTIAEFVEDDATRALLASMGVDYVQGFGSHRPCSFAELLRVNTGLPV